MTDEQNPWRELDLGARELVHPDDRPFVDAFNEVVGRSKPSHHLVTSAYPEPWAGRPNDASVLVLSANPGWSAGDDDARARPEVIKLKRKNLTGQQPLLWLEAAADGTPGAAWYRERLLTDLLKAGYPEHVLAREICVVDFHGYHSVKWHPLPITLPTQQHVFDLVRRRLDDDILVICTRAGRDWRVAVPELGHHSHVYETRSNQNPRLSPKNLGDQCWVELTRRLV